jgi:hypothetical protein
MNITAQLEKYCQPLSRYERCILNRKWLDIRKIFSRFPIAVQNIHSQTELPSALLHILYSTVQAISEIKNNLEKTKLYTTDNFISACSAFVSLITIYLVNIRSVTDLNIRITSLINYVLLYVTVDHTLDSEPSLMPSFKNAFTKILKKEDVSQESGLIKTADKYYQNIYQMSPKSIPFIIQAANCEFNCVSIQSEDISPLKTCYSKGETSARAGCSVITNGEVLKGSDVMGRIGQLYDDIIDVGVDIKDNIKTFATECYVKHGNVDLAIETFAEEFSNLPSEYDIVKPLMLHLVSTFLYNSSYVSEDMRLCFLKYSLLLRNYNFDTESMFYFV